VAQPCLWDGACHIALAVPNLRTQFEADAAALLGCPPGQKPTEVLARFRRYRQRQEARLKQLHRSGGGGRAYCQARAAMIDVLLRHLWRTALAALPSQEQTELPPLALVALGGYGRAELNPFSDLDLMLLHPQPGPGGEPPWPALQFLVQQVFLPLFDLGFKVGYSVRTVAEAVQVANQDMQSKTSLLEARLIVGEADLFAQLQAALMTHCLRGREQEYLAARLQDQAERRARHGNSPTMQEPHIKHGCGGLRDYHNVLWMGLVRYGTRSLAELQQRGLLSPAERRQLVAAHDFLLRVRTELHYQAGRAADVLTRSLQPAVAYRLGYTDRSPLRRLERFMRELFLHMRHVHLIARSIEERMAQAPGEETLPGCASTPRARSSPPAASPVVDGFQLVGPYLLASHQAVFRAQPSRLMRVFFHAHQRGVRLHPNLTQLIHRDLPLVDRSFRQDPGVNEMFLQILNERGHVAATLRAMHETGLLGRYLPEFGRLTCLVQHEFFHLYAADEHTLQCLEQLDQIWAATAPPLDKYRQLLQEVEMPALLRLALLLHDAGKAQHLPKHAPVSARLASRVARRLRLDEADRQSLSLLVEHHLAMAQISQRHDLDDPAVIGRFARLVQTPEHLRMLTLLTVADTRATSEGLWTGFKDTLLFTLYRRTSELLARGPAAIQAQQQRKEHLAQELVPLLPRAVGQDEVQAHLAHLPPRYFRSCSARDIANDLLLVHRFLQQQVDLQANPLAPIIGWQDAPDRGCSVVKVVTWDRPGLFSKLAGSFSAAGINILSAEVFTRSDGIVLDTFHVTDPYLGGPVEARIHHRFERLVQRALTEPIDLEALIAAQKPARPFSRPPPGLSIPTRIGFDNSLSENRTVLEIITEDRVGLLYAISRVLTESGLDIVLAKITTENGAAIDTFYVTDLDGRALTDPARQDQLQARLRAVLQALG